MLVACQSLHLASNHIGVSRRREVSQRVDVLNLLLEFFDRVEVLQQYDRYRRDVLFPAFDDFVAAHEDVVEQRYAAVLAEYEIERQASNDEYMSGEGTATFCKKCAFLWDVKEMRLCSQCQESYHPFRYKTCFNCLPQVKKKEVEGRHAFYAEMDAVMKSLEEANE